MRGKTDVEAQLKGTDTEGLDLLPADFSYRHMDLALDATKKPTTRLRRVLEPLDDYDYTFLDCPPSISLVSESVFEAADALLVPIIPATLSSRTLDQLHEVLEAKGPRVLGFFSMADRRKRLHRRTDGRALERARRARRPSSRRRPTSSGWGRNARRSWTSRRAAAPPALMRTSGQRSARALPTKLLGRGGGCSALT